MLEVQAIYQTKVLKYKTAARPDGMTFGIVLSDYDTVWHEKNSNDEWVTLTHLDRNSRNEELHGKQQGANYNVPSGHALPAVARFVDDRFVSMTCDLQWWIFDMNKARAESLERAKADWNSCWRDNVWMTNYAGTWSRHDCINENGKPDYMQAQPMMCGGALFRSVGETAKEYLVEAINPLVNDYRKFSPEAQRWLFFRPTLSARVKLTDAKGNTIGWRCWYQEPMHFFGESMEVPVFGFIPDGRATVTGFVNRLPKFRARILGPTETVPNPFVMRDGRKITNPYVEF